jgi:hypothetical protein
MAMTLDVLSREARVYLLGLYFTDGCKVLAGITFTLASYEREIVDRIAKLFEQIDLSPKVYTHAGQANCIRVCVNNVRLRSCFPDKNVFLSLELNNSQVIKWINRERLETHLGVPFVAGLMDGDGFIDARVEYGHTIFGSLHSYWTFFQMNYPFLVDFVKRYVELLAPGGAAFNRVKQGKLVNISARGREALLAKGIAIWSVKVRKWSDKVERLRKMISDLRAGFLSPASVAVRLRQAVNRCTIREWCDRGYLKHIRIRAVARGPFKYLIPSSEVERLNDEIRKSRKYEESMLLAGECLTEQLTARVLGVKPETVYHYCYRGMLRNIPLSTLGGKRSSLIPLKEVQKWIQKRTKVADWK